MPATATARIQLNASRADVRRIMARIPSMLAGRVPDPTGLVRDIQKRIALVVLSLIKEAFAVKARGGTDACGEKWAPLAESTIARRRLGRGDKKLLTVKARLAALPPDEQKRIKRDIRDRKALLLAQGVDAAAAERIAREGAFSAGRARGGLIPTKRGILGARSVEILRDEGLLLASLSPGNAANILETLPGRIIVGTNDPKAWYHQFGTSRMPARRIIPPPATWPADWWRQINQAAQSGVLKLALALLARERASARGGTP